MAESGWLGLPGGCLGNARGRARDYWHDDSMNCSIPTRATLLAAALVWASCTAAAAATDEDAARAELATYGALYGVGFGLYASVQLDLNPRPAAWLTAASTGGILYGALEVADARHMTLAEARFVGSSGTWAMVDALLLAAALEANGDGLGWYIFGAGATAATAALLAGPHLDLSDGRVSAINSGGLWVPIAGTLLGVTLDALELDSLPGMLLFFNLAGLTTGALLSGAYHPSRDQVLYMDAGALLGTLTGGLVGAIVAATTNSEQAGTAVAFAGLFGGALGARRGLDVAQDTLRYIMLSRVYLEDGL